MKNISSVVILWFLIFISACTGKDPADFPPLTSGDPGVVDVAVPYVESVDFPSTIKAGVPFSIALHISAPLFPEAFFAPVGRNRLGLTSTRHFEAGNVNGYTIDASVGGVGTTAPPVDSITLDLNPLPTGDYRLFVYSADTSEHGGFTNKYVVIGLSGHSPHPWLVQREFPFTVVP